MYFRNPLVKHKTKAFLSLFSVVCLFNAASCRDPRAQQSAIVREVEAAGSGNLDSVTYEGVRTFLAEEKNNALTKHVAKECGDLMKNADAHWTETSEYKVCRAAINAAFLQPHTWTATKQGY